MKLHYPLMLVQYMVFILMYNIIKIFSLKDKFNMLLFIHFSLIIVIKIYLYQLEMVFYYIQLTIFMFIFHNQQLFIFKLKLFKPRLFKNSIAKAITSASIDGSLEPKTSVPNWWNCLNLPFCTFSYLKHGIA